MLVARQGGKASAQGGSESATGLLACGGAQGELVGHGAQWGRLPYCASAGCGGPFSATRAVYGIRRRMCSTSQRPPDQGVQAKDMHPIAPRARRPFRVSTPLPIYQNAPLDEISVYQVIPQTAFFGPDPLPDPQIGLSCHQLEKFPPAAQQGAPAGHSRVPTGTSTGRPSRPTPVQ